ncbi:MAG TPA: hypothetical protein VL547_05420 [Dinghuibacter sp.]|jgi:hypothetical protein|uniref:hypothetical protein n=1 Tax=Dinghuibacter sp. TaxID=2024697 RepID=UPI002C1E46D8|nr:hypothetical protein [Dinghuibacter sp.]HTJ11438.1 hypothetical protein [Dinghuibacter sp.]
MQTLHLKHAVRKGDAHRKEREFLEFYVSGRSLKSILGIEDSDLVTSIDLDRNNKQILNVFRGKEKSRLETGRVMIYVCPECGDIGCGAITAIILDRGAKIIWSDFGSEAGDGVTELYAHIEPIEFDRQSYFSAFSKLK